MSAWADTPATEDCLGHDALAAAIVRHLASLPAGSVIAIQGSWGRGKTDVLGRVEKLLEETSRSNVGPAPLRINPWQYGTPNLIAPLVVALVGRMPASSRGSKRLRRAAHTLLRAGNAMAFKALSVVVPFGEVLEAGKDPVDEMIGELFDGQAEAPADLDPVRDMAQRFRDLVDEYLAAFDTTNPLVVCVDDLDRCLPDHQIAMLEAIHFLTGSDANAYFVVALDPTLVAQAAVSHYGGRGFDTNQYLDKLFDLRVTLTGLAPGAMAALIDARLNQPIPGAGGEMSAHAALTRHLGIESDVLRDVCEHVLYMPELANPRLVERILHRMMLVAVADVDLPRSYDGASPSQRDVLEALVRLIAISERWPPLRSFLQSTGSAWQGNLQAMLAVRNGEPLGRLIEGNEQLLRDPSWLVERMPNEQQAPDLGMFLADTLRIDDVGSIMVRLDFHLTKLGL